MRYMQWNSEDRIEREAERMMDRLDKLLIGNEISLEEYDLQVEEIDFWTVLRYEELRRYKRAQNA